MTTRAQSDQFWLRVILYAFGAFGAIGAFAFNNLSHRLDLLEERVREQELIEMKHESGALSIPSELGECVLIRSYRADYQDDEIEDEPPLCLDLENLQLQHVYTRESEQPAAEEALEVIHVFTPAQAGEKTSCCTESPEKRDGIPPGCNPPALGCEYVSQSPSYRSCKWSCPGGWTVYSLCGPFSGTEESRLA